MTKVTTPPAATPDFTPYRCPMTGRYTPCIDGVAVVQADEFVREEDAVQVAKYIAGWQSKPMPAWTPQIRAGDSPAGRDR